MKRIDVFTDSTDVLIKANRIKKSYDRLKFLQSKFLWAKSFPENMDYEQNIIDSLPNKVWEDRADYINKISKEISLIEEFELDIKKTRKEPEPKEESKQRKKITAKQLALLHYIKIRLGKEDRLSDSKKDTIAFFNNKYKEKGEGMYKAFIDWKDVSETAIAKELVVKDYKGIISEYTDDADVLSYLNQFPHIKK